MQTSRAVDKIYPSSTKKGQTCCRSHQRSCREKAHMELTYCNIKGGIYLKKTLNSAIANAEVQWDARRDQLYVLEVRVDEGPRFKRAKSKARGGKTPI